MQNWAGSSVVFNFTACERIGTRGDALLLTT